jgi:hypothetical protein
LINYFNLDVADDDEQMLQIFQDSSDTSTVEESGMNPAFIF